jgi:hypothetical protein
MRPNTLHYVVTLENSIVYGRHFYPTSTVQRSVLGIIHTFVMSNGITNMLHDTLHTMLRRMMVMWYENYNQENPWTQRTSDPHCPEISTAVGLLDVIAVGNLLECGQALDRRTYHKAGIHWAEQGEMAMARWRYRMLQTIFARYYLVTVGGKPIHPISVFRRSLVEFAAGIIVYKKTRGSHYPKVDGCSAGRFEEKMISVFLSNHPELVPVLKRLVAEGAQSLTWTGPAIEIQPRRKNSDTKADLNFEDFVLYPPAPLEVPVAPAPPTATKRAKKVPVVQASTVVTRSKASTSQDAVMQDGDVPDRPARTKGSTRKQPKSSRSSSVHLL